MGKMFLEDKYVLEEILWWNDIINNLKKQNKL